MSEGMTIEEAREKINNIIEKKENTRKTLATIIERHGCLNLEEAVAAGLNPEDLSEDNILSANKGIPIQVVWIDYGEGYEQVETTHFGKLTPYIGEFLSARENWEEYFNTPVMGAIGKIKIGKQIYDYECKVGKPDLGRKYLIWAFPKLEQKKKKKRLRLHIYGYTPIVSADTLKGVQVEFKTLDDIRWCFPKVVGEDANVCVIILAIVSRLNKNKDFWIMGVIIRGVSSAGKNHLAKHLIKPWEKLGLVDDFSRLTGAYMERNFAKLAVDLNNKILVIYELSRNTPQQLHIVLSEGKLRVGVVDKDTGDPVEYVFEGTPFLLSTTPSENLRTDLLNRIVTVTIDESDNQTEGIVKRDSLVAKNPKLAKELDEETEYRAKLLATYLNQLKPAYVIVPYADVLLKGIKRFHVNLRRDWKKVLGIIQASALLFQKHRPKIVVDGEEVVVATFEDYQNMMRVFPILRQTLSKLTEPQKRLLDIMVEQSPETTETLDEGVRNINEWTANELTRVANKLGWSISDRRVRQILNELQILGYVSMDKRRGKNYYMVINTADDVDFTPFENEIKETVKKFLEEQGIQE